MGASALRLFQQLSFLHIEKKNKQFTVIKNLFDKEFCSQIIQESEAYAKTNGWASDRHKHYPTVDNEITADWKISKPIANIISEKIYPELQETPLG